MKSTTRILIAFLLNLGFSTLEFFGGLITGSVAIMSDAFHDAGDALSTGVSFFLELKSTKHPDDKYTYGYARYSILGALITTAILMSGSLIILHNAIERIQSPTELDYQGMLIFSVFGIILNTAAALVTHERHNKNVNQRAVSLHMLEDSIGWLIVLIGSIAIGITKLNIIDSIMSIALALFLFFAALKNLGDILNLFLEKAPANIRPGEIKQELSSLPKVESVHHIHLWSLDGQKNYATLHAVITNLKYSEEVKASIRQALSAHGINHVTIEIEDKSARCKSETCQTVV